MVFEPIPTTYLTSKQVRTRYGGISDMSLWRWENDPNLNFPKPIRVNNRRLYLLHDLERWEAERSKERGKETSNATEVL